MVACPLPRHVALVMDGNGRWATRRSLPRAAGHRAGVQALRSIVEYAAVRGIEILTVYAFSSENWQRPSGEIKLLLQLFMTALESELDRLRRHHVRLCFAGAREEFPQSLQKAMTDAESATCGNTGLLLNVAANYGGRWDITRACQALLRKYAGRSNTLIDESALAAELSFPECVDPDLFIRTGGEYRISNYLLWQLAYTELYFIDVPWPEFSTLDFDTALHWYASRQRRFGRTEEQLQSEP